MAGGSVSALGAGGRLPAVRPLREAIRPVAPLVVQHGLHVLTAPGGAAGPVLVATGPRPALS